MAATGIAAVLDDRDDDPDVPSAPAVLPGARALGSDLSQPGRATDCRGRAPRASSPSCTIVATELVGRTIVIPDDGVIRRWAVRSARGEMRLSILRPRGGGAFQIARSRNEFVGNDGVHVFDTNLAVERGDLAGLLVLPGSAVGTRAGIGGARARRWIPNLATGKESEVIGRELLLRADFFAGGEQRVPESVSGAAADGLPDGRVHARRRVRFTNGRPVEIRLVALGGRFVLDQFLDGKRTARTDVPDFRPGEGRIVTFDVSAEPEVPQQLGIHVEFAKTESSRILSHFYGAHPREFAFVD